MPRRKHPDERQRRNKPKVVEVWCRVPVDDDFDFFSGLCGKRAQFDVYTFRGVTYGPFCISHAHEMAAWIQQQREQGDTE